MLFLRHHPLCLSQAWSLSNQAGSLSIEPQGCACPQVLSTRITGMCSSHSAAIFFLMWILESEVNTLLTEPFLQHKILINHIHMFIFLRATVAVFLPKTVKHKSVSGVTCYTPAHSHPNPNPNPLLHIVLRLRLNCHRRWNPCGNRWEENLLSLRPSQIAPDVCAYELLCPV